MLSFYSANVRSVNSRRAAAECLKIALGSRDGSDCRVVLVHASLGHRLDRLAESFMELLPGAEVLGNSCCAVVGRESMGDSMNEVGIMAVCGPEEEVGTAHVSGIVGENSYEKGLALAQALFRRTPGARIVYLLCPGIDLNHGQVLSAFDQVFGSGVTVFGGAASDNMRGLVCHQYCGGAMEKHGAWAVGFADPSLRAVTRAAHGFTAYGEPITVTQAQGNRIQTLDGMPAWQMYTGRLLMPADCHTGDTIGIGALAEELPQNLAEEYGNPHILRVATKAGSRGELYYPVDCRLGTRLWLTVQDEALVIREQRRALQHMRARIGSGRPVAVFQADCLVRGRFGLMEMIRRELSWEEELSPWLGMFGFGGYAGLGGKNAYHSYATALMTLYRE